MGDPFLFTSIAAVAIGGASILGGSGSYLGTIAGALILTVLTGLLPILKLDSGHLSVIYGTVILVTVALAAPTTQRLIGRAFARRRTSAPWPASESVCTIFQRCIVNVTGRTRTVASDSMAGREMGVMTVQDG